MVEIIKIKNLQANAEEIIKAFNAFNKDPNNIKDKITGIEVSWYGKRQINFSSRPPEYKIPFTNKSFLHLRRKNQPLNWPVYRGEILQNPNNNLWTGEIIIQLNEGLHSYTGYTGSGDSVSPDRLKINKCAIKIQWIIDELQNKNK